MTTKTTLIAKALGANHYFNDKLVDGRRSLKVCGWDDGMYEKAKNMLEELGCEVKIVKFPKFKFTGISDQTRTRGVQYRLHVRE